jgi:hypothetical protein
MAKKKRPTDTNQLAKSIVDIATGESEDKVTSQDELKSAAAMLGRKGGLKGGKARAKALTKQQRHDIAKKAAAARWSSGK